MVGKSLIVSESTLPINYGICLSCARSSRAADTSCTTEDLTENEHTKLAELAKLNSPLLNCYVMADELRHLWKLGTRGQVIALVMDWIHRATHSKIKPLVDFAKNLRNYVSGIISSADHKINTSVLEGVNNKIKQVKRRAYGFRDDNYFFLKVKAAFPGLP